MKITRRFTEQGQDALGSVEYEKRTSRITNPDGSVVFEMHDAEIPKGWSQLATDIMVSKYFRKAGAPLLDEKGQPVRDAHGNVVTGPEKSVKQVVHRLAGCWRWWGEQHGYFDTAEDAQAFYDEIVYMLLHQMAAPNSPQWFNTGLNFAYGITGPSQGHYYCDPRTGELMKAADAYTHPQPHACFIQAVSDDLVNTGGIMDLWVREARLFKYGSGTGSNFSKLRGENEPLSGGGKSSGLMSFLRIGDRAAGAIKSGGTTRRAAKMVCLDLDHPDIEQFVNWKVREELKVAAMAEGIRVLPERERELARRLRLRLDYDFNGEGYYTVSGQNSNNSVRVPHRFFKAVEEDGDWNLTWRTNGKVCRTIKARDLWDEIAFAAWRCADPGVQFDDTINQWHTCPRSGRINASNPCVTGDTRVLTPGGIWRRIDQMIHLPSRVVTNLDGQEIHGTDGAFPTGTQEVYELRTVGGYTLKLTANHRVWTRSRGWVEARFLTNADEVKLLNKPACVQEIGDPQDARFFHLLGLFVSQANGDATALHLDACLKDARLVDVFSHYVADNWGQQTYDDDYVNEHMVNERALDESGNTLTVTLTNRRLLSRLGAFIRHDSRGPHLTPAPRQPRLGDEAFTAGLAAQRHMLRALFTADARLVNGTLELPSDNLALLEDVQILLLGFGVQSCIFHVSLSPRSSSLRHSGDLPDRRNHPSRSGDGATQGGVFAPSQEGGALAPTAPRDADSRRHGLRIDPGSLRSFVIYIGLLPGRQLDQLTTAASFAIAMDDAEGSYDRVAAVNPIGRQQVFDLTEPVTGSFIANGITVHNCSEYMFIDDTACNLASLNVMSFFDAEADFFDVEAYQHAIRLWTIVLEVSVLMASFPSESIARLSYKFRTLGLGYANLGAMLMQAGVPYNSDKGRAICAALTAILTGEAYATSAEMAQSLRAFPAYDENKADMLRVVRNHRRAAYDVDHNAQAARGLGQYEGLEIRPVGIDASRFSQSDPLLSAGLLEAARECWDRALDLGQRHGYHNAQVSVIAPTGTIGLLMDCDTTGVEPDFALVKFKKLAGGGYFKIANQSLQPALVNLGYSSAEIHDILQYVLGTLSLDTSPHINRGSLGSAGLTDEEIEKIEKSIPGVFELSFAFSPWTVGKDTLNRLGIPEAEWQAAGFSLLRRLGFTRKQIDEANDVICGRGTVEGAPHLKDEHLPVFDCASKCDRYGKRCIPAEGHIRMMAAAQPFITGAISKTINLPNEASVEDIKSAYLLSWRLGLKANALYRDGSKLSQPLNVKSDKELDGSEDDDEENEAAAKEEIAKEVADAAATVQSKIDDHKSRMASDNLAAATTAPIEKIIERIVERPLRRRLPDTRRAITHKFDVAGHEGYITVGLYDNGSPGEVFITMAKEGSTIGGLMDTVATLVSLALQYGVSVDSLVRKFEHVRFEPSGPTRNLDIPFAKSLVDYIFRWLAMEFVSGYRSANAPKRGEKKASPPANPPSEAAAPAGGGAVATSPEGQGIRRPGGNGNGNGNGHGSKHEEPAGTNLELHPKVEAAAERGGANVRLIVAADPLSQQSSELQADAPACDVCGSITVRSGTCYKCLNCGNSMGCS